jgi:hypothetical protein
MKFHPAVLMLFSWLSAYAIFFILPFRLESRVMTLYGFLITAVFLATFCIASLFAARPMPQRPRDPADLVVNFQIAPTSILMIVTLIAVGSLAARRPGQQRLRSRGLPTQARSDRATGALLEGAQSASSTIWFQLGFL